MERYAAHPSKGMTMDTPEERHKKIATVVRLQCQVLCRKLDPVSTDTKVVESPPVSEHDLGELIDASRAWQQAVKTGDLLAIEKCESDFTAAWERFETTRNQASHDPQNLHNCCPKPRDGVGQA
jgi:hypothetical protein